MREVCKLCEIELTFLGTVRVSLIESGSALQNILGYFILVPLELMPCT